MKPVSVRLVVFLVLVTGLGLGAVSCAPMSSDSGGPVTLSVPMVYERATGASVKGGRIGLYRDIPKQPEGAERIVLEAERYEDVTWQPANTKTMVSETWIREVQARGIKRSTPHPDASDGACIERASVLTYPFFVTEPGEYTLWMRYWRPSKGFWCHNLQLNDGPSERIALDREPPDKTWFWQKAKTVELKRGNNIVVIQNLHNGKKLDKFMLTRNDDFTPEGHGPERTPQGALDEGTIAFETYRPAGVTSWDRIAIDGANGKGTVSLDYSFDDGKTWTTLGDDGRIARPAGKTPETIRLRMTLKAAGGEVPEIEGMPRVVFTAPGGAYPVLNGNRVRYSFSSATGAVSGIEVVHDAMREFAPPIELMPRGTEREPFRVFVKPNVDPPVEGEWIEFDAFELVASRVDDDRATFRYRGRELPIEVTTRYTVTPEGYLRCEATIDNDYERDVLRIECPRLTMVRAGAESADDTLIWPVGTGKKYRQPVAGGALDIGYPKAAVGYFDLYDDEAGLYMGSMDPDLIACTLAAAPDASRTYMTFSITKKDRVRPGETQTFVTAFGAHPGDWHTGADWYGEWFRATFDGADWPEWLEESDGWLFANVTYDVPHYAAMPENVFRRAITLGFKHVQCWGTNFTTGGGGNYYYPPHHLGGPEAFGEANEWWKDRDGVVGYYMFPNGINMWTMWPEHDEYFGVPWTEIPAWGRPPGYDGEGGRWDWALRNARYGWQRKEPEPPLKKWKRWDKRNDSLHEGYAPHPVIGMCPVAEPWLEWYKTWVVDYYTGRFHTGSSYNDTMHLGGDEPMFNPHLGLHGEGTGGQRRQRWAKDIRDAARALNPEYVPTMEMQTDAYGIYFGYMIGASAIDTEMLYYTHPTHLAFQGQTGSGQYGFRRFKRYGSAWCYGSRLDQRHEEGWAVATVRMRNWITRWVNDSRFIDDLGMTVDHPEIRGKLRRIMAGDGSRGFLATFWHEGRQDYAPDNYTLKGKTFEPSRVTVDLGPMAEVDDTGTRPEDWIPRRAFLIDFNRDPKPIDFDVTTVDGRPQVSFMLPSRWINGVLFVREARGEHGFLARCDQKDFEQLDVHIINPGNERISGTVSVNPATLELAVTEKRYSAQPGEHVVVSFPYPDGKPPVVTELVLVDIEANGATRQIRAAAYPFMDDASFELSTTKNPRKTYNTEHATDGERSMRFGKMSFVCEASTKYKLTFDLRALDKANYKARLEFNEEYRSRNKLDGVQLIFDHPIAIGREWETIEVTFETPELFFDSWCRLKGPRAKVLVDNVRLEKLPADAEVQYKPTYRDFPEGAGP